MSESAVTDGASLASSTVFGCPRGVLLVRLLIGALLLATAALKVLSPAESVAMAVAYHIPPLLTAMVVQMELALAALLLCGCWTRRTLTATALLFAGFGAFSIYRGWAGYESCGCFGSFQVNPWIMATLDGIILLLAAWGAWKSTPARHETESRRLYRAGGTYALAGLLAAIGAMVNVPLTPAEAISDVGNLVIIEPDSWIGQPFPLASHLTPKVRFDEGRWTILLYHHDCPHCQEAVTQYEQLAAGGNGRGVALIETPPYGSDPRPEGKAMHVRLTDAREWFVQTPVEIQLDEGIVVSASLDLPAVSHGPSLLSRNTASPSALFVD